MTRSNLVLPAALVAAGLIATAARAQTWTGAVSTDWTTAGNWNPATVPDTSTAVVNFTGLGLGSVNISTTVSIQSLTFSNPTGSYTLTSTNAALFAQAITEAAGVQAVQTINLGHTNIGTLLVPTGGTLTIANNSSAASLVIGPNTVIGEFGSNPQYALQFGGSGNTTFSGAFATSVNPVATGLQKVGTGTLDYSGDGSALSGGLQLAGGTLELDYSTSTATKLGSGALQLNGGVLQLTANASIQVTQSFSGGTLVASGHTDTRDSGFGAAVIYAAGNIARSVGGTVDFSNLASPSTTTGNTNGLLGNGPAFGTVGGGSNWATNSGGNIVAQTVFGSNTYAPGTNTNVTQSATVAGVTTNSLRFFTGGLALTLSGTNTLQSGGILVTPNVGNSPVTITGGTLASGVNEVIVHAYGDIMINSAVSATAGLTKAGFGTLTLGGVNTGLTGPINVNRGNLAITTPAAITSASQINFNDASSPTASQQLNTAIGDNTNGTISPPISLSTPNMYLANNNNNSRVTLAGAISSANGLTTPIYLSSSSGTGGFNLTGADTFTGNVTLQSGFLGINAGASLGNAANTLILSVPSFSGGLEFLNGGVTIARPVVIAGGENRIICNGNDSNTISGVVSGGVNLYKDGTGTLTLANPGNSYTGGIGVVAGTLSLGSTGGLPAQDALEVSAGATFSAGTSTSPLHFMSLILDGGTLRATGTGQVIGINQFVSYQAGLGGVDFTGAGADTLSFEGASPTITIYGNSTWLSPANTSVIANHGSNFADVLMTISPGVTLTNGFALQSVFGGFRITGGGTLYQNSDATNVVNMNASITVTGGSTFRVTDASTMVGGQAVGNFGTGPFTLDGGTFDYGGSTATTAKGITLTANGGTIQIESAAAALTVIGIIIGPGPLTKSGPGTLVFSNGGNSFFTTLNVTDGTVQTTNDNTLGSGAITIGLLGSLSFTGTTTTGRTIANSGTITVAAGQTLTFNGATVGGGFLRGAGTFAVTGATILTGVTTFASTTISQIGAGSYTNFTNGGAISIAANVAGPITVNGFSNEGSGSITIGAVNKLNASDFQSYGVLTINPAVVGSGTFSEMTNVGTTPLYFNGGSRTFLGTPSTANSGSPPQPTFVAGIDLHGQNAVVAGGLFVNNGFVVDSSNGGAGTATIIADYGSLVKGAGFYQNPVITQNGGRLQAGNSPGVASFGRLVFGPGGVNNYVFAIDDATGSAGPSPDAIGHVSGWGMLKSLRQSIGSLTTSGDFTWTATPTSKLTVAIDTLVNPTTVGTDVAGPMADFDPNHSYLWPAAHWDGSYFGPNDVTTLNASSAFDSSAFLNPIAGTFGWNLDPVGQTLSLTYTPSAVPEPGTWGLTGSVLAFGWVRFWRRRWHSSGRSATLSA
jgi:autotransporter-associated beta strand protein